VRTLRRVADGVAAGVSAEVLAVSQFTPEGIILVVGFAFAFVVIGVAVVSALFVRALDDLSRRLDSVEMFLELDSASRRPTTAPPPPPPSFRIHQGRGTV